MPAGNIIGRYSGLKPDVLKQTHLPKISFIHVLENTGHMGMWENAAKVNDAVLEFILDISTQDE